MAENIVKHQDLLRNISGFDDKNRESNARHQKQTNLFRIIPDAFNIEDEVHEFHGYNLNKKSKTLDCHFQNTQGTYKIVDIGGRHQKSKVETFFEKYEDEYNHKPQCWCMKKKKIVTTKDAHDLQMCIAALLEDFERRNQAKSKEGTESSNKKSEKSRSKDGTNSKNSKSKDKKQI